MEDAFRLDRRMLDKAPWQFSWQKNERNLVFNDPLKLHLVKGFAAKELNINEEVCLHIGAHDQLLPATLPHAACINCFCSHSMHMPLYVVL